MGLKIHNPDAVEAQPVLWEGEVARRRPKKAASNPDIITPSLRQVEAERTEPWPVPDYASTPIVTWVYVAPTLQAVLLTGREAGMPLYETTAVFSEDGDDAKPKTCARLTKALFLEILQQLDQTSEKALGEERAAKIRQRWDAIREFAAEEGWTR